MTKNLPDIRDGNLAEHLTSGRCLVLRRGDKRELLEALLAAVGADAGAGFDPAAAMATVLDRENTLSTNLVPGIAVPHARLPGMPSTMVAVCLVPEGMFWDADAAAATRLVILIIGDGNDHLRVMGIVSNRLANQEIRDALMAASEPEAVYSLLASPYPAVPGRHQPQPEFSTACFRHALAMARETGATKIVLHADAVGDISFLDKYSFDDLSLIVTTSDASRYPRSTKVSQFLSIPFHGGGRSGQMEVTFLFLVSRGMLGSDDRVVSVCGIPESGMLDTVMLTNPASEYHLFFPGKGGDSLPDDIEPQVLSRVLQVACNLAAEGREGKPVGTFFVIGDHENVHNHCRQMVINPFKGYGEDDRNILDPRLEETIKEFSRIDGAFVLRGDGVIMAAGAYIRTEKLADDLPSGLGARHAAAAIISGQTKALSVAISESTKKISLFRGGSRILEL